MSPSTNATVIVTPESMPTDYQSMIEWIDLHTKNMFYKGGNIFVQVRNILPERLQILIEEVAQFIDRPSFDAEFLPRLREYYHEVGRLADLYYDEFSSGTLPYYVCHFANRLVVDVRGVVFRFLEEEEEDTEPEGYSTPTNTPLEYEIEAQERNASYRRRFGLSWTDDDDDDEEEVPEVQPEPETAEPLPEFFQTNSVFEELLHEEEPVEQEDEDESGLPQTSFGMEMFMASMQIDNMWRYSDIVPDQLYNRLSEPLRAFVDELTNILGLGYSIPDNRVFTQAELQNPAVRNDIQDLYNRVKGHLYESTSYYETFITNNILSSIGNLIGRSDLSIV